MRKKHLDVLLCNAHEMFPRSIGRELWGDFVLDCHGVCVEMANLLMGVVGLVFFNFLSEPSFMC